MDPPPTCSFTTLHRTASSTFTFALKICPFFWRNIKTGSQRSKMGETEKTWVRTTIFRVRGTNHFKWRCYWWHRLVNQSSVVPSSSIQTRVETVANTHPWASWRWKYALSGYIYLDLYTKRVDWTFSLWIRIYYHAFHEHQGTRSGCTREDLPATSILQLSPTL